MSFVTPRSSVVRRREEGRPHINHPAAVLFLPQGQTVLARRPGFLSICVPGREGQPILARRRPLSTGNRLTVSSKWIGIVTISRLAMAPDAAGGGVDRERAPLFIARVARAIGFQHPLSRQIARSCRRLPPCPASIVLARWRGDRRAGRSILIKGIQRTKGPSALPSALTSPMSGLPPPGMGQVASLALRARLRGRA